jgi:hypothetical protein
VLLGSNIRVPMEQYSACSPSRGFSTLVFSSLQKPSYWFDQEDIIIERQGGS